MTMLSEEDRDLEQRVMSMFHEKLKKNFPKTCSSCNTVFQTERDYLEKTTRNGPAMDYAMMNLMHFERNCRKCSSTVCIQFEYAKLDALQLYSFFDYVRILEEAARDEFAKLPDKAHLSGYKYKKYFVAAVHRRKLEAVKLDKDFWRVVGLNIFRDIYNDRVRNGRVK